MSVVALILLFSMLLGIWRVLKGPALLDRLLTIQLFGSTGVAILLVLSKVFALPALLDVALLLAILAAAAPAARWSGATAPPMVREPRPPRSPEPRPWKRRGAGW